MLKMQIQQVYCQKGNLFAVCTFSKRKFKQNIYIKKIPALKYAIDYLKQGNSLKIVGSGFLFTILLTNLRPTFICLACLKKMYSLKKVSKVNITEINYL